MGKSSKKSNVEAPDAVSVSPVKSAKKGGKRDSDQVIAKSASVKKQKVDVVVPIQSGKKPKKASIPDKEPKASDSEDITSSESEEEEMAKKVVPEKKRPSNGTTGNAKKKQVKRISDSDSDSEEDHDDDDEDDNSDDHDDDNEDDSEEESEEESEDEPLNKPNRKDDDDSEESEEESEDEPLNKPKRKDEDDSEESEEESEDEPLNKPKRKDDLPSNETGKQASATKSEKKGPQTPAAGSKTLFVGNLSFNVSEHDLMKFFKEAGEVIDVRLSQNSEGQCKGFGHVEFADKAAAQKAVEMNGQELLERAVRLDFAHEKGSYSSREGGGRGGRGSSGGRFGGRGGGIGGGGRGGRGRGGGRGGRSYN